MRGPIELNLVSKPQWTESITGLVFDLDGVLLLSRDCHRRAFEEVLSGVGSFDFDYDDFAGWRTPDVFRTVFQSHPELQGNEDLVAECSRRKTARARQLLDAEAPLAPQCIPILTLLPGRYQLALASSGSRGSVQAFLDHTQLHAIFQSVLSGDDVQCAKPHPEIFETSMRTLGLLPMHCVVIEDAVAGIRAARSAGAHAIGMGNQYREQLTAAGAECVVGSLPELAGLLRVL
jgi:HAD superfamily hydrolase (TIGR01509 family)